MRWNLRIGLKNGWENQELCVAMYFSITVLKILLWTWILILLQIFFYEEYNK